MFGAARRCSSKLPRFLFSHSAQRSLLLRDATSSSSPINARILISARQLHQSSGRHQEAVAEAPTHTPIGINEPPPSGAVAAAAPNPTGHQNDEGPVTRFADLERREGVDRTIVQNITHGMRLEMMTEVQTATINEAIKGTDMLVVFILGVSSANL
jgi:ATP-dependent RNA helicase MSS116, mitochondrial